MREAIGESRTLSVELSPPILAQAGLPGELKWLAEQKLARYGLTIELDMDANIGRLGEVVEGLLFQSVRELLFNIVKHAGVKRAQVALSAQPDGRMALEVADAGEGFDPALLEAGKSLGLFSIRERLELVGGQMTVTSAPGQGCRIRLEAPGDEKSACRTVAGVPEAAPGRQSS